MDYQILIAHLSKIYLTLDHHRAAFRDKHDRIYARDNFKDNYKYADIIFMRSVCSNKYAPRAFQNYTPHLNKIRNTIVYRWHVPKSHHDAAGQYDTEIMYTELKNAILMDIDTIKELIFYRVAEMNPKVTKLHTMIFRTTAQLDDITYPIAVSLAEYHQREQLRLMETRVNELQAFFTTRNIIPVCCETIKLDIDMFNRALVVYDRFIAENPRNKEETAGHKRKRV